MKLFPHAMIRLSGGPFEKLESLNLVNCRQLIDAIIDRKEKIGLSKQSISNELYHIIPQQTDSAVQNLMVHIRRDIFNERSISPAKITQIIPYLPPALATQIENYNLLKEEIKTLRQKGEALFTGEVMDARGKFKTLTRDENFRKGLLLGSQSLYQQMPGYFTKPPSDSMKKKDAQVERGITRYFSRMHGKTSPFSTFTNLAVGKIIPDSQHSIPNGLNFPFVQTTNEQEKNHVVYHIRLNNYLYSYLKLLLTKNVHIYRNLLLRANPTIQKHEDHNLYLTNSNNIEAFQRIPDNPALEVFLYLLSEKKAGLIYKDMIHAIIANEYIDAPVEDLEDFVNQLIEFGFLEFDLGVSGIDPDWDKELHKKLMPLGQELPIIKELLDTLISVRQLAEQYGSGDCDGRTRILAEAFQQFKAICMKLHEDAGLPADERKSPEELRKIREDIEKPGAGSKDDINDEAKEDSEGDDNDTEQPFKQLGSTAFQFTPEKMFYEDTSLDNKLYLDEKPIREFIDCLHQLLQKMTRFEGQSDERQKMLYYFINKYGEKASVPLLTFYEDFYRDYKKPESLKQEAEKKGKKAGEKEKDSGQNGQKLPELPLIPEIQAKQERNKKWMEKFQTVLANSLPKVDPAETVKLYLQHLEQTDEAIAEKMPVHERDCSYGCFMQFFIGKNDTGQEQLMGALNASFPGFGKMVSRFLHIFAEEVTADMRTWNQSLLNEQRIFLEDSDASFFNANLHPPLMPYEIHMPNGQNSLPPEKQVPITDLQVKVDEACSRLQLLHVPTQKRVFVFDLGFQGHMGRSQLFQLLEKFTLAEYLFCAPMLNALNSIYNPKVSSQVPGVTQEGAPVREVRILPRIIYEDRIILQRKTWYVPAESLPLRKAAETDWAWFMRVNEWRRALGIPGEVFIFVVDRIHTQASRPQAPGKKPAPSRDDYKPQYICFHNPFLMDLLGKAMTRVPDTLKIVEMLPNSQQLLTLGNHRHIMEFVIQWYTREINLNDE